MATHYYDFEMHSEALADCIGAKKPLPVLIAVEVEVSARPAYDSPFGALGTSYRVEKIKIESAHLESGQDVTPSLTANLKFYQEFRQAWDREHEGKALDSALGNM